MVNQNTNNKQRSRSIMRTRQAFKNMMTSLLLQMTLAISGIIVPRLFTEVYGSTVNGFVSSVSQFITYMFLVEAGIGAAGTVALYGPLAKKETDNVSEIVAGAKSFYMRSGWIFAALVAALMVVYPMIVADEIADTGFVRVMIFILCINGIIDYFYLGKYRVLLRADQKEYIISLIQIAGTIVMTIVSVILIQMNVSALIVKAVAAIVYILRSLAVGVYVKMKYKWIDFHAKPNLQAFDQRWAALLHQVVGMIVTNTDVVLLTLLLKDNALVEVSVYSAYSLVAYALSGLMNSISNGLGAGFGQVISQKETGVLRKSFNDFEYLYFLLIFIAYTCMGILLYPFIKLYSVSFADAEVYVRWSLVALFTLCGLFQSIRLPGLTIICAAGHFKQTETRAILEAVINLGVSIALIGSLGIVGVLIGTCMSYLYRTTDVIVYNAKNFLSGSLSKTWLRLLRNFITAGIAVFVGIKVIPETVSGWLGWFVIAMAAGIGVTILFCLVNVVAEPKEFKVVVGRFKSILGKMG